MCVCLRKAVMNAYLATRVSQRAGSQAASKQYCAGAADSPQGFLGLHTLLFRWLTERSKLVNGAENTLRLFRQVSGFTNYNTMEQEFQDIDSSGRWQNLYNVSRDTDRASLVSMTIGC